MQDNHTETAERIRQTVAALKTARPFYGEILEFYEKLCLAQEASKKNIALKPIRIPDDLLTVKRKERFSLISKNEFVVDARASEALLKKLCKLAVGATDVLSHGGSRIVEVLDKGILETKTLFSKILDEDSAYWDKTEKKIGITGAILAFFTYNSIKPSLRLCAQQVATYLDEDATWGKGYCPICGSAPALAMLRNEGQRFFLCGFCGHEWTASRVFCPFCETKDTKKLHYFFSEEEKNYRVDVCDQCKRYIKTIDTRKMTGPSSPFLELVSTLHLDILAQEQGLESGLPLWLQT